MLSIDSYFSGTAVKCRDYRFSTGQRFGYNKAKGFRPGASVHYYVKGLVHLVGLLLKSHNTYLSFQAIIPNNFL